MNIFNDVDNNSNSFLNELTRLITQLRKTCSSFWATVALFMLQTIANTKFADSVLNTRFKRLEYIRKSDVVQQTEIGGDGPFVDK